MANLVVANGAQVRRQQQLPLLLLLLRSWGSRSSACSGFCSCRCFCCTSCFKGSEALQSGETIVEQLAAAAGLLLHLWCTQVATRSGTLYLARCIWSVTWYAVSGT
jgi:hypothetical protein